ncbi:LOW QUALITY PROTEIN: rho GTPase-activating protein 36-like [Pomacea canaliculata]|uniref:LOW QUALITY PROTEIN: rho GTPase-activating protein 36-like n=1 Tax=Pomacea canaliculata TaxID=400727 RepID=UPI000D729112|nr:LOW QUALITY PROTEIN: rho GTPase-activating protein 36-like [Pomacea canaliculata]
MLVRRRSSQTLQTVVEHLTHVMAPDPQRPRYNSNSDSNSGANTPRSFDSSSRRSSLTSRNSYSDNYSVVNSSYSENYHIVSWADLQARLDLRLQGRVAETRLCEVSSSLKNDNDNSRKISRSISSRPLPSQVWPRRSRSKSLPDLQVDLSSGGSSRSGNSGGGYSDDEDGDDFGFLSRRRPPFSSFSPSAAAMHKPKVTAASPTQRLLPRRWRGKGKSSTSSSHPAQAMWTPEGPCTWCSVSGRKVLLKPVNILQLSEAERLTLQKIALAKLQAMDLACPIVIPKDAGDSRQHKKRTLSLKRRSKSANLSTLLDTLSTDKAKIRKTKMEEAGLVFGIPLARCIANDQELLKRRARSETPGLQTRSESADQLLSPRQARKSSSSSQGSLDNGVHNGSITPSGRHSLYDSARRAQSSDSLSESEYSGRNASSSLIDALSLSMPSTEGERSQAVGSTPQVPLIVEACFKHLETYGLHVLGIFRVGSSKKRVKQLREEFDSGQDVQLTEEHNPHDIGALLKEFFRDLPEPLLTRDLYLPFVATRKLEDREQQAEAVRLLLTLLPPANRDTLWALLRFLATVHRHSADSTDGKGREVSGNKMDSHNLATLFGPNVLHRARAVNEKQFMAECAEQAEQSAEVISVVKDMIDNHYDLFEIAADQRDEVLRLMMEADQENLDRALRRLAHENQIEPDPESTCSVFEDAEVQQSLPHSANSDADLLSLAQRRSAVHRPLRVSRSADPWTDPPHPDAERTSSVDSVPDRTSQSPSPQGSPTTSSPPRTLPACRPASVTRPPFVTVSQESPNPEVVQRVTSGRRRNQDVAQPAGGLNVRAGVSDKCCNPGGNCGGPFSCSGAPHSEVFSGSLVIPRPPYVRENSGSSTGGSGYPSSPGDHSSLLGSDCSGGQWGQPSPSYHGAPLRRSSGARLPPFPRG